VFPLFSVRDWVLLFVLAVDAITVSAWVLAIAVPPPPVAENRPAVAVESSCSSPIVALTGRLDRIDRTFLRVGKLPKCRNEPHLSFVRSLGLSRVQPMPQETPLDLRYTTAPRRELGFVRNAPSVTPDLPYTYENGASSTLPDKPEEPFIPDQGFDAPA
jgi:hypothetical protein